jgi:DNA mismatch repair protein MutS
MAKSKVTPIRKQYLDIKRQYPDAIIFFRLGDFYETFDEDAKTASRELDLILTGRNVGKGQRVPMAGVPHHAAEGYIAKLIDKGYKVALCEQIGTETVNGLMPRDVTRVFTAGTVVEPGMLDAGRNNYLAALLLDGDRAGLAYTDLTTGEFATTQLESRRVLEEELARLRPAELLLPDNEHTIGSGQAAARAISRLPAWRFEEGNARQALLQHFDVSTLAGFGCDGKPLAIQAAGAVIGYLHETQKGTVNQIQRLATYSVERYMSLDSATRKNLELIESLDRRDKNSLLAILDVTITAMGKRLIRERVSRPLLDIAGLNARLDQVELFFADGLGRDEFRAAFPSLSGCGRTARSLPRDSHSDRAGHSRRRALENEQTRCHSPRFLGRTGRSDELLRPRPGMGG